MNCLNHMIQVSCIDVIVWSNLSAKTSCMDLMMELKLVRIARLRWGLGTWICRRYLRWFECWTRGRYHRQRRPALGLEDGVEVGFVDGIEDDVVDWFVGGYVECVLSYWVYWGIKGWQYSGSDEGQLLGSIEGSADGSNVWTQWWYWRQFSTWSQRWC